MPLSDYELKELISDHEETRRRLGELTLRHAALVIRVEQLEQGVRLCGCVRASV